MFLLLNPTVRYILLVLGAAVIVIMAYAGWSNHLEQIGAQAEKDKEAAIAIQHEQEVQSKATAVDQAVSQDQTPQDTLNKQWSQP
jgi:Tfp pilus assembly protein PilO